MNMTARKKAIIYGILSGVLTALFLAWGVFVLRHPYLRVWDGVKDAGTSIAFYLTNTFAPELVTPTVATVPQHIQTAVPESWDAFAAGLSKWGDLLISRDNLTAYFSGVGDTLTVAVMVLSVLLPFIVLAVVLFRRALRRENNDHGYETKPLRIFKAVSGRTYVPVKRFFAGWVSFARQREKLLKFWLFLILLNFNVLTIILEVIAYVFYLSASFTFAGFYVQFYKLLFDIGVLIATVPGWVWFFIVTYLFLRFRRKIALIRLRHMEMKNRGFINSLPIAFMLCGSMGTKKTTMLTDMALSQAVMFRDKAHEMLVDNDLKFPCFPWIRFEKEIQATIRRHEIFNLATCKRYVQRERRRVHRIIRRRSERGFAPLPRYGAHPCFLWGYDFQRHGLTYDDGLKVVDLLEVLEVYAQLYFIYIVQSSLILSNYAIRTDAVLTDTGNFPLWNADFFSRDSRNINAVSTYAHILDFDMLRIGRRLDWDGDNADAFEFGVVPLTEAGKERGNMVENKHLKKDAGETNQLNDGFDKTLKMIRHAATVDNFPFVRVAMDEQRPESIGANVRELAEIIHIRQSSERRLALPFFFLEELLYDFLFGKFTDFYGDHRFTRGDTTLSLYIAKKIAGGLHRYYSKTYNLFGYFVLDLEKERGTQDGKAEARQYYLSTKKIYAKRFATDALGDFYSQKALRSDKGLADLECYQSERATLIELGNQNSYFIKELESDFNTEDKE